MKPGEFHSAFSKALQARLAPMINERLDLAACTRIYTTTFELLTELFQQAKLPLENEAANWLAQQYYDGMVVNGGAEQLDPNVFDKRARPENIPTRQLALLATMMTGTDFAVPLLAEIRKRS